MKEIAKVNAAIGKLREARTLLNDAGARPARRTVDGLIGNLTKLVNDHAKLAAYLPADQREEMRGKNIDTKA